LTRTPSRHAGLARRLLASSCLGGVLGAAGLALAPVGAARAADAAPAVADNSANPAPAVEEIVVTGSLIRRTSVETPSPVTVLSADQLAKEGILTLADAVRSVSADNSGTIPTAFSNGFAAGSSGVALRGLTVNSTLVLIDGLRTSNYPLADDGVRGFVDLNTIDFSAVERVEVLKDGASSAYGADAIGGVVNIITKPTFQGEEGDASVGDSQHGGGFSQRYTVTVGHGDLDSDKYNAYVSFEYQEDDRIKVSQRGFPYNTTDLTSIGGANNLTGSNTFGGSVYGTVTPATLTNGNILTGSPVAGALAQPLRACGALGTPTTDSAGDSLCEQDTLLYQDVQPKETRYGVLAHFTAQFSPHLQGWIMASYNTAQTVVDQAPAQIQTSFPTNTNSIALPALLANGQLNPNDPFAAQGEAALISYAFGDIPSRDTLTNHVARFVTGVKGDTLGWDFTASVDVSHSWLQNEDTGLLLYSQLAADIADGAYSFINPSSNSAAVRAALSPTAYSLSTTDLDSLDVSATRHLFTLPGGPLSIAVGGQFRYEAVDSPAINPGTYQALSIYSAIGNRTVGGLFAEIEAPIIKQLTVNLSGRYDHYSDFGDNFSPKVGVKFTPIRQIAFRATYSEGFRAPAFAENGNSSVVGFVTYSPPASYIAQHPGSYPNGGDGYVQAYSLGEFSIGNPAVKPETSKSYTIGAVIEPVSFFSVSVDYYHITKANVIGPGDQGPVLAAYYAGTTLPANSSVTPDQPDPNYPNALPRPSIVSTPYVNSNAIETQGVDVDARAHWTFDKPFGLPQDLKVTTQASFTDILDYNYTFGAGTASAQTYNYVGTQSPYNLSSGAGTPQYRMTWTTSFTYGPATLSGTLNYVSGILENAADLGDATGCTEEDFYGAPTTVTPGCRTSDFFDFDLTGSYQINDRIQVYFNVLNLFDASAPLDPVDYAGGGANYNPTYTQAGIIGRFFRIGFHVKY
jgi:iron complex outermembrane receptor protein